MHTNKLLLSTVLFLVAACHVNPASSFADETNDETKAVEQANAEF